MTGQPATRIRLFDSWGEHVATLPVGATLDDVEAVLEAWRRTGRDTTDWTAEEVATGNQSGW